MKKTKKTESKTSTAKDCSAKVTSASAKNCTGSKKCSKSKSCK